MVKNFYKKIIRKIPCIIEEYLFSDIASRYFGLRLSGRIYVKEVSKDAIFFSW